MTEQEKIDTLRALLVNPEADFGITRVLAIVISASLVITVLWLVKKGKLREEYTPIWMVAACALAVLSLRFDLLWALTQAIGAWTLSSTIFFLGEVFLTVVSLNYAVRLSRTSVQLKNLAQEIALMRKDYDELRGRFPTR